MKSEVSAQVTPRNYGNSVNKLLSLREFGFKASFDCRPFGINDAVVDGVAKAIAMRDHVVPKNAFFLRANPQQCPARFLIQGIGLELDPNASEVFEGVSQHQILRFSIRDGSLPGLGDPGPADFKVTILFINVRESRAANDARRTLLHGGKWQGCSCPLPTKRRGNVFPHLVRSPHQRGSPAPEFGIKTNLAKLRVMFERQRFQPDMQSLKRPRHNVHSMQIGETAPGQEKA